MKKTTKSPTNIKDEVDALNVQVDGLKNDVALFDTLKVDLDKELAELEAMESGIDEDIDTLEKQGQDDLVHDAIEEAEDLESLD